MQTCEQLFLLRKNKNSNEGCIEEKNWLDRKNRQLDKIGKLSFILFYLKIRGDKVMKFLAIVFSIQTIFNYVFIFWCFSWNIDKRNRQKKKSNWRTTKSSHWKFNQTKFWQQFCSSLKYSILFFVFVAFTATTKTPSSFWYLMMDFNRSKKLWTNKKNIIAQVSK